MKFCFPGQLGKREVCNFDVKESRGEGIRAPWGYNRGQAEDGDDRFRLFNGAGLRAEYEQYSAAVVSQII